MPSLFSIGDFDFLTIRGLPQPESPQVEVTTQPGFDGVNVWLQGKVGQAFRIQTIVDIDEVASAESQMSDYLASIGTKLELTYQGETWSECKVVPLRVTLSRVFAVANLIGGIGEESTAMIICDWDLIAVPAS